MFREQRTDVGALAIEQLNEPSMHNTNKNEKIGFKFLCSVDPE
jgi:hypothetical protein